VAPPVRFTDSITVDANSGTSEASLFVNPASDYLKDHFPGAPTLPGLVMLEAAVRAAGALWDATRPSGAAAHLEHVERLQVVRRVVPGETFVVQTAIDASSLEDAASFTARGTVAGAPAMRARFSLRRGVANERSG